MPQGFDHIVHTVRNLDAAADVYVRAGFTVSGRNRHSWGTHNRIMQFKNCYIEILEVAEPEKIVPHGPRFFSFGAFNRDFLSRRDGLSMLLLNSRDAAADARSFEANGIGAFDVFDFAREGTRPDGSTVKLAFSLAYTAPANSSDMCFAACQHHFPENFWSPALQTHANGAQRVAAAVMVANHPDLHRDFLAAYVGAEVISTPVGVSVRTQSDDIEIFEPSAVRDLYGIPAEADGDGITFNAVRFAVADLTATEALHQQNGLSTRRQGERLVVSPKEAFGATLIFEAAKVG